ncbi:MAG: alpha/beta hydrolase [Actinomycetia bacterium]|nr:alpha/beta hydrolase [Actinomycetes bacterium]
MPFADANGQKLYYTDSGGDGPAVLLSHGFLMGHDMWNHQVTALQDGYRVVAYDERGWGQSEFTSPFTFWDMADDAIALLDHLGIAQAVLGGMSQGGFLTLRAALRYPDRVRGMILIDTQARAWVEEEITGFTGLLDTVLAGGWNDELVAMFYGLLFGPGFDDPYWSGKWRSRPPETVIPAWECLRDRDDVTDRLGEIACPALIVHGEVDAGIAIEDGRVLEDKLPNVVGFCAVPGAGHTPNVERPDIVNPAIRSFLDELS